MHSADETPAPVNGSANQSADIVYHVVNTCQGCLPGAPQSSNWAAVGHEASEGLVDLYLKYLSKPTWDRREALSEHCFYFLNRRVCYWVFGRHFCPAWLSPQDFSEEAIGRARVKFSAGLCILRTPSQFDRWLKKVAFSAVGDELRKRNGRAKDGPRYWGPLEVEHPDGSVTYIADEPRYYNAVIRSGYVRVEDIQFFKHLVHRQVLGKLFDATQNCSRRQREGIELLRLVYYHGMKAGEIAAERGVKKSAIDALLREAKQKLREIAETKLGFSAEDL